MSLKSKLAAAGLAAAFVAAAAMPALAVSAVANTNVNVRSCASTTCRVVDVLRRGEWVDVDYCDGLWCAVSKPGPDGWVNARYLSRDFDDDFDDYDFDDDDFDRDIYIVPRVYPRYVYPRRFLRRYDPDFSACVGGPNARFCVYD